MKKPSTVAFHTLGCKLNFAESSSIARSLIRAGYKKVDFSQPADLYVINTCSVTDNAEKECRKIVKTALKNSPEAFVAIIGCYAQLRPQEIASMPGVDLVLGASEKFSLLNYLEDLNKKANAAIYSCNIEDVDTFISSFSQGDRTRAFLKIQDGCDYTCSFCTIPFARGKSRSDSIKNVVAGAQKIAALGVKEIVLTGVNIGDFGKEAGGKNNEESFFDLIRELDHVEGIERFRISSIEPNLLKDEIIEFVAFSKRFAPHFHIPLQSGSDKILGLMRRRYRRGLYAERVSRIKSLMPHCCIGADIITGFPSESEQDFLDTYNFINDLDVSYLHVFTYSEREGTDALKIEASVPVQERKRRTRMLRILSAKKTYAFYEKHTGQNRPVLFEGENKEGFMYGFTDNYIKVRTSFDPLLVNRLENVRLAGYNEGAMEVPAPERLSLKVKN